MWNTLLIGWASCLNKLHDTLQRIIPILTAQLICTKSVHSAVWPWKGGLQDMRWLAHMKHGLSLTSGGGNPPCRVTSILICPTHSEGNVCQNTAACSIPSNFLQFVSILILCCIVVFISWEERNSREALHSGIQWKMVLYQFLSLPQNVLNFCFSYY